MRRDLRSLAEAMQAHNADGVASTFVDAYSTDSRQIPAGALFFALRGDTFDGHDYAGTAIEKGAAAVVVDHELPGVAGQIIVDDTLKALQAAARYARRTWPGQVIGVTGSAGKTTAKDAIFAVLSPHKRTAKTQGNLNNHVGLPLSVLQIPDDAEVAVMELGMNHAGEIRALSRIAAPDIGVVTNVGTAHIEHFDSIDAIALAKRELIEELPPAGTAVLNADDPRVAAFAAIHPGRSISFGTTERARIRATQTEFAWDGARFTIEGAGEFVCGLPGRGGVMTALSALACASAFGIPLASTKDSIAKLTPGKMRFQRILHDGVTIWDDCYNSNPEAAKMMLELLMRTPAQRHIAVLGEMLELGRLSKDLHRDVGSYAAQCGLTVLVGIRGAAQFLVESAQDAGLPAGAALFFPEPVEAGKHLRTIARSGDAILFKGSRGTRVELALEEFLR